LANGGASWSLSLRPLVRREASPLDGSSVPANTPLVLGAVLNCSESRWPSHWCHSKRCLEGFVAREGNVGLATFGSGDSLAGVVQDLAERGGPLVCAVRPARPIKKLVTGSLRGADPFAATCWACTFTPWRVTADHRPIRLSCA
jgi:hypothetical protein